MSLILSGTDGLSDVDGTAATPAIRGTDANTGIFFPAADTIAFAEGGVESMRIDSSGRVGIGTSSPSFPLDIASADANIRVAPSITTNNALTRYINTGGTGFVGLDNSVAGLTSAYALNIYHSGAYPINFSTNGVERARIDSSGNLGLGVSPSAWFSDYRVLQIGLAGSAFNDNYNEDFNIGSNTFADTRGGYKFIRTGYAQRYVQTNSGQHRWLTSNISGTAGNAITFTQAMTLDASGNLLVGATSQPISGATSRFIVSYAIADYAIGIYQTNASPYGQIIKYSATPNNTGNDFLICIDGTASRITLRSNGGIANYSANDVNLSDRREKTNFAPAKSYLDVICAIPVQTFNYIDQNMEDDGGLTLGVVAQDVQAVAPELVMESNWASKDEEPKMRLSIYQTDLQYALMKCIQEQQALITQLTARITALEGA